MKKDEICHGGPNDGKGTCLPIKDCKDNWSYGSPGAPYCEENGGDWNADTTLVCCHNIDWTDEEKAERKAKRDKLVEEHRKKSEKDGLGPDNQPPPNDENDYEEIPPSDGVRDEEHHRKTPNEPEDDYDKTDSRHGKNN